MKDLPSCLRAWRFVVLAAVLGPVSGCLHFNLKTPAGFAIVQSYGFQYRALAAYGAALSVRELPNDSHGDLSFWSEAIDRTIRAQAAYHSDGVVDVRTKNGVPGKRLQYTYGDPESASPYWVCVFVTPKRIFVLETGGSRDAFTRAQNEIEQAILQFEAN